MANDSLNMVNIVRDRLGAEIKSEVTEALVRDELKEYEIKLRELIKPKVEKLVVTGVESMKDMMRLREELHVFIRWNDEKSVEIHQ